MFGLEKKIKVSEVTYKVPLIRVDKDSLIDLSLLGSYYQNFVLFFFFN